jgi:hypothetical protein
MNDLLKNPFLVFVAGLLALYLVFAALKVFISFSGLIFLAFVALFIFNSRFRGIVRGFLNGIFNR